MEENRLHIRLAGGRDAPCRARSALSELDGALKDLREQVRLLVSELVTNSVVHAGVDQDELVELEVDSSPERVRVELTDSGPGFRPSQERPEPTGGGLGLFLVDHYSTRWGTESNPTRVWFEIDR